MNSFGGPTRLAVIVVLLCGLGFAAETRAQSPVAVWEETLVIPTYEIGPPDPEPMFYSGRTYQGAKGKIYPYPLYDNLLDVKDNKTYTADYLENKYVKICVLPGLGGRIFSAQDKSNGYDYVYRQTEIKPALIGMIGAWISGGVEWNIPHHHRASSYLVVDHRLVRNPDGSSTIWVGEVELRHRMKWLVGMTLYPSKSYLEITTKLLNRTPIAHSFLDFTNVGVHASENYQVIFPPDTQFVTQHGKVEFAHWPISQETYGGVDYTRGVDISWWKNHPSPVSFFNWGFDANFFGGYDHGKNAGIIDVQDHYVSPGAKFFEWGNGPEGEMWDRILDSQGPYLELMAGNFSDNQPDYSWDQPYGTKEAKQFWYPIRGIDGAENANLNGAVNLEIDGTGRAHFGFSTTQEFTHARVMLTVGIQTLFERTVTVAPGKPLVADVQLPAGTSRAEVKVALVGPDGQELISYQPKEFPPEPMPNPVKPPAPPQEIKTVGQLYQTGLRLEQLHSPAIEPYPYYDEALRRDSENYEVNTALGRLYCGRGMWQEAEPHLQAAIASATRNYTHPRDGEAYYYLGVALQGEGKNAAAAEAFNHAAWDVRWQAPSCFLLAELWGQEGDLPKALDDVNRSLAVNTLNAKGWDLKAAVLRRLGRAEEAVEAAGEALSIDPIDLWATHELAILGRADAPHFDLGDPVQSNLELAVDYYDAGMIDEASEALKKLVASAGADRVSPLVEYYLGYFAERKRKTEEATTHYRRAGQMPVDFVFPFRLETVGVLEAAMKANPDDARAPYYLGNLLFDLQPEAAIQWWERAAEMDSTLAMVHRNLALAYEQTNHDTPRAIASMERALKLDRNNARFYYELDKLYEAGNVSPERRLASFESSPATVAKRSDGLMREIKVCILVGKYDEALGLLGTHHFHNWEGEGDIHDVFMDAHLLRGEKYVRDGKAAEALRDFEAALDYPENLQVGKPFHPSRLPEVDWLTGVACMKLGNDARAKEVWAQAAAARDDSPEMAYYRGLAQLALGDTDQANRSFAALLRAGEEELRPAPAIDWFAKFGEKQSGRARMANAHYLIGLASLAKGDSAKADVEFRRALELDVNHLGARRQLSIREASRPALP